MAAPSVGHAEHHSSHNAGTHATGICAWFCAAGQDVESSTVDLTSVVQFIGPSWTDVGNPVLLIVFPDHSPRGPPVLFL